MSSFSEVLVEKEEEDGLLSTPGSKPRQSSYYKKHSSRLSYTAVFLVIIIAALISALVVVASRTDYSHKRVPLRPWEPPRQHINKVFWPKDVFGREPSKETDEAWDSLFPEGGGFVDFKDDDVSNPPLSERRAVLSVFHQLHCLEMLRTGYFAAVAGNPDDVDQGPGHLSHCWDYLHQAIMCHGDTTMEWVHEGDPGSSGWGYEHQCNDFDAIFSWVEARKTTNHTGIPADAHWS